MQKPIITLNGDRPETLVEQLLVATQTLWEAIEKVSETLPNGRNYQTANHIEVYRRARREHEDRMEKLRSVHAELSSLRDYCQLFVEEREINADMRELERKMREFDVPPLGAPARTAEALRERGRWSEDYTAKRERLQEIRNETYKDQG